MTSHTIQSSPQLPSDRRHAPFVLIADDSVEMRALLVEILTDAGYEVRAVPSGGRAFAEMSQRVPDLLITDLMMPGMNGFSLRAEMLRRTELASVPVIVLSAYWHRPSETLEVNEILPKPLNIDRLLESVRRLTGTRESLSAGSD
jgi:CheY-like chemotaxis protein